MLLLLILGLVLAILIVTFIFQNTSPVIVHFLAWHFQGSLALVLLLTVIFSIIISLLVAIPLLIRKMRRKTKIIDANRNDENLLRH